MPGARAAAAACPRGGSPPVGGAAGVGVWAGARGPLLSPAGRPHCAPPLGSRASRSTGSRVLSPHFVRNLIPHPFPSASLAPSYFILLSSPFCSGSNGGLRLLRLTPGSQSISDQAEFQRLSLPTSTLNSSLKFSPCVENEQRAKSFTELAHV